VESTITEASDFATAARASLQLRGWSQEELAKKVGKSTGSVNGWLTGKRTPPLEVVFAMEDALRRPRGTLARFLGYQDLIIVATETTWEDKLTEAIIQAGIRNEENLELLIKLFQRVAEAEAASRAR
jgi:transcriptional regulator with XRE-family HTH domain